MNLVVHMNEIHPNTVYPYDKRIILSGFSGKFAYSLGLLETNNLTWTQLKRSHKVNCRSMAARDYPQPHFSQEIRKWGF